ncbi:MAG: hypothetical protein V8R80_12385 [Eubacterium sp.]
MARKTDQMEKLIAVYNTADAADDRYHAPYGSGFPVSARKSARENTQIF